MYKRKKKDPHRHGIERIEYVQKTYDLVPYHIGIIIDNQLVEVMHCTERLAMILTSGPTFIDLGDNKNVPPLGSIYDNGIFSYPRYIEDENLIESIDVEDKDGDKTSLKLKKIKDKNA